MRRYKWSIIFTGLLALIGALTIVSLSSSFLKGILVLSIWLLLISFIANRLEKTPKKKKRRMPEPSDDLLDHYYKVGMTDEEIIFFRKTMAATKKQIQLLEQQMNQVPKLKAINLRHDTLIAAKGIFKELVKEPRKLHRADQFLYTHLPNLVELSKKYIEINNHDLKNKQTYQALDKSASVIDELSQLVLRDYEKIVADDLEDLEIEVSLAEKNIQKDTDWFNDFQQTEDKGGSFDDR